jgi:hypothetical protein
MPEDAMRYTMLLVAESDLDLEQALFGSSELSLSEILGACTIRQPDASDIPDSLVAEWKEDRAAEVTLLDRPQSLRAETLAHGLTAEMLHEAAAHAREAAYRLRRGIMASPCLTSGMKASAERADELAAALNAAADAVAGNTPDAGGTTFTLDLPPGWEVEEVMACNDREEAVIRVSGNRADWWCALTIALDTWNGNGRTPNAALLDALKWREKDNAGSAGGENDA